MSDPWYVRAWNWYSLWVLQNPVSGTIVSIYLVLLLLVALSARGGSDEDSTALGGMIALGVVGLIVLAVIKWSVGVVFAG